MMIKEVKLKDLYLNKESVSMEAVGIFHGTSEIFKKLTSNILDAKSLITNRLTSATAGIKTFFNLSNSDSLSFDYYLKFAEKYNYLDLTNLTLQVPDGFEGNITNYTDTLLELHAKFSTTILDNIIKPFDIYISQLINNPSLIESQTFSHKVKTIDIEKNKKEIAKYIKAKKHNTKQFKEIYSNMNGLKNHHEMIIKLYEGQHRVNSSTIKPAVDLLNDKLLRFIDVVQDKQQNMNPSAKTIRDISELTYVLAESVEFFAVIDNLIISLLYCCSENNKAFKRFSSGISPESVYVIPKLNKHYYQLQPLFPEGV